MLSCNRNHVPFLHYGFKATDYNFQKRKKHTSSRGNGLNRTPTPIQNPSYVKPSQVIFLLAPSANQR